MASLGSLGIGIVGVGVAGQWYAGMVQRVPGARLVAACRSHGGDTEAIERSWRVPCFDQLEEFLSDRGVEAVCVATPSGQHYDHVKMALEAGKHVLVDKPITLDATQANELVALARDMDLRLGVILQSRLDTTIRYIKSAIATTGFGKPLFLNIVMPYFRTQQYYDSTAWRGTRALDGGGILMNQGSHLVDVAIYLFGEVDHVSSFNRTLARELEVEDTAVVALAFKNGALGTIAGTVASSPGRQHTIDVVGSGGSVRFEGGEGGHAAGTGQAESTDRVTHWDVPGVEAPSVTRVGEDGRTMSSAEVAMACRADAIKDFVDAVTERRDPFVTGGDAQQSVLVINAAYASAREGCSIALDALSR